MKSVVCVCVRVCAANQLHFLTHFSTDEDKIWCGVEAIQAEDPDVFLFRLIESREINAALLTTSEN